MCMQTRTGVMAYIVHIACTVCILHLGWPIWVEGSRRCIRVRGKANLSNLSTIAVPHADIVDHIFGHSVGKTVLYQLS